MTEPARGETPPPTLTCSRADPVSSLCHGIAAICRGMCAACYQACRGDSAARQASAPAIADQHLPSRPSPRPGPRLSRFVRRQRVYPPRTVDRPGICVGCQQTRIIKARGLCSGCRKRHPERALPVHNPSTRLEDVPTWTDESRTHLDALAERVLRGEPVVGDCSTRRDKDV